MWDGIEETIYSLFSQVYVEHVGGRTETGTVVHYRPTTVIDTTEENREVAWEESGKAIPHMKVMCGKLTVKVSK